MFLKNKTNKKILVKTERLTEKYSKPGKNSLSIHITMIT